MEESLWIDRKGRVTIREIKYRAWDKVIHKLMNVTSMVSEPDGTDKYGNFRWKIYYVRGQNVKDCSKVEHYSGQAEIEERLLFEQYTGLHDINGKEIYEGDIVQPVRSGLLKLLKSFVDKPFIVKTGDYAGDYEFRKRLLIVGNIHENPEFTVK
ncbi:YopX family protein [Furfurilactobacillus entadae]|uniref:YopX family protein n=1 Tax=Furfurilactobacillus entadae TaxID=2922307 RepID=UPI0035E7C014